MKLWDYFVLLSFPISIIFFGRKFLIPHFFNWRKAKAIVTDVTQDSFFFNKSYFYIVQFTLNGELHRQKLRWTYWYPNIYILNDRIDVFVHRSSAKIVFPASLRGCVIQVCARANLITLFSVGILHWIAKLGFIDLNPIQDYFGVLALGAMIMFYLRREINLFFLFKRFKKTTGIVTDLTPAKDFDLDTIYTPTIKFRRKGEDYEFTSGSYLYSHELLSKPIQIAYDKANPKIAEIWTSLKYSGLLFWGSALILYFMIVLIRVLG